MDQTKVSGTGGTPPSEEGDVLTGNVKKDKETLEEIRLRGYSIGTWNGVPMYTSVFDHFSTVDLEAIEEYVANHRSGLGVYGSTGNQKVRAAALAKGKKKA